MRIASWNVNSIRSRIDQLTAWLSRAAPDVACLQETKVTDDKFPLAELQAQGYHLAFWVAAAVSISRTAIVWREIQLAPVDLGSPDL